MNPCIHLVDIYILWTDLCLAVLPLTGQYSRCQVRDSACNQVRGCSANRTGGQLPPDCGGTCLVPRRRCWGCLHAAYGSPRHPFHLHPAGVADMGFCSPQQSQPYSVSAVGLTGCWNRPRKSPVRHPGAYCSDHFRRFPGRQVIGGGGIQDDGKIWVKGISCHPVPHATRSPPAR